jgi:acyl-CoA thioesterase
MNAPSDNEQILAERVVSGMMAKDAFSQWLGITLMKVEPRVVTTRLTVRGDMVNGFGVCHGGVTFSLADSALAFASNTHGRVTVSIENSITYPRRIEVGDVLTATAEEESATNRLAFYRVTVRRSGEAEDIVALFRGTVYKTNQEFFSEMQNG